MKTIGAKELRLHLNEVLDQVLAGEDIVIKHRFKEPVRLQAVDKTASQRRRSALAGLHVFDTASKKASPFNSDRGLKELYHESIAKKYLK